MCKFQIPTPWPQFRLIPSPFPSILRQRRQFSITHFRTSVRCSQAFFSSSNPHPMAPIQFRLISLFSSMLRPHMGCLPDLESVTTALVLLLSRYLIITISNSTYSYPRTIRVFFFSLFCFKYYIRFLNELQSNSMHTFTMI